jgi:hypothetical protein
MDIRGKGLVAKNIEDVVRFYIKTVQQDHNTPHQEAACYAIMELATKVDPDAVRSFAAELVEAVMLRMQRTNPWPVVDAAMAATAAYITAFPLEIEHLAPALCDLMHEGTGHSSYLAFVLAPNIFLVSLSGIINTCNVSDSCLVSSRKCSDRLIKPHKGLSSSSSASIAPRRRLFTKHTKSKAGLSYQPSSGATFWTRRQTFVRNTCY